MNNCPGRGLGHRSPRLRRARVVAVITATAGVALLAAACGGSPSSTGAGGSPNAGGSANSPSAVAWSQCVRSHGIPNFPDPNSSGQVPKETAQQLGASDSALRTATAACARLDPYNQSVVLSPAQQRQVLSDGLKVAQCMRSHGVPKFPDPTMGPDGPRYLVSTSRDGFSPSSPQILAKGRACIHELPAGTRLPSLTVTS
jgi:hypothetical protein